MADNQTTHTRPGLHSAQRATPTTEQRAPASSLRAEGERGRSVDRASPRRGRFHWHAEGKTGRASRTSEGYRQGGARLQGFV